MFSNKSDENAYVLSQHRFVATIHEQLVSIVATVRQPFEDDDDQWLCAANIAGLFHRKKDLEGSTSEEAVRNAQRFLVDEFNQFMVAGGVLRMADQPSSNELQKSHLEKLIYA